MKRIIWIAENRRHKIMSVWFKGCGPFRDWKIETLSWTITKHYIEV